MVHLLQAFSYAVRCTVVQKLTSFKQVCVQLPMYADNVCLYVLVFLFYNFYLSVPCGTLSRLVSAFERTLK